VAIAGDGSCRQTLAARAGALGLGTRVRWAGHLEDVRDFHQALDVYVQTSDNEGVPNAVLEAMAVETPVVATDVGGTGELLEDGVHGLLVPRRDVAALTRAIASSWLDAAATGRRVRAARARIERELSFEARVRAVESIYEELVAERP
jgi:glycosyltransferase involved in cell wall biosynthesis